MCWSMDIQYEPVATRKLKGNHQRQRWRSASYSAPCKVHERGVKRKNPPTKQHGEQHTGCAKIVTNGSKTSEIEPASCATVSQTI